MRFMLLPEEDIDDFLSISCVFRLDMVAYSEHLSGRRLKELLAIIDQLSRLEDALYEFMASEHEVNGVKND